MLQIRDGTTASVILIPNLGVLPYTYGNFPFSQHRHDFSFCLVEICSHHNRIPKLYFRLYTWSYAHNRVLYTTFSKEASMWNYRNNVSCLLTYETYLYKRVNRLESIYLRYMYICKLYIYLELHTRFMEIYVYLLQYETPSFEFAFKTTKWIFHK